MGPRLNGPRLDHDSRCRFLLLWSAQEEERALDDLGQHDVFGRCIVRGALRPLKRTYLAAFPDD